MAVYTGYARVLSKNLGGFNFNFDTRIGISSISRTNNTVTFNSMSTDIRVAGDSYGASFSGIGVSVHGDAPDGSRRYDTGLGSGTFVRNGEYGGGGVSFSFGVGANDTSASVRPHIIVGGTAASVGQSVSIPSAGSPSGQSVNASNVSVTSAQLNASISNWGANCTAGSGQRIEYKKASEGSWTNLAYSTSTSHNRTVNDLAPGTEYQVRTYTSNGAGKTGNSSTITFTTLPAPNTSAVLLSIVGVK